MPDFTPSRSDAIRDGLIERAARHRVERGTAPAVDGVAEHIADRRRGPRRGIQWAAAAVALTLIGGVVAVAATAALNREAPVAGDPSPSPTLSVSPAPSPSPSPTPTKTPTPTPTPTQVPSPPPEVAPPAQDPAEPSTWIVSRTGMGPLTIGMPFSAAIAAVPQAQDACGHAYFIAPDSLFFARWGEGEDDPLDVVTWSRAEGPRTIEGIGIGSSPEEVRAAYPDAVEVLRQGTYLQSGSMFFRIETGVVDEIGVTSNDVPYEYCG